MSTTPTSTTAPYDHANDPAVRKIIEILGSHFEDLDDGDDTPFGYYGVVATDGNVVTVSPDQDVHHWDGPDNAEAAGPAPTTPVVRITVERIA